MRHVSEELSVVYRARPRTVFRNLRTFVCSSGSAGAWRCARVSDQLFWKVNS